MLTYGFIKEEVSIEKDGKRIIEWLIFNLLNEKYNVLWETDSQKVFKCNKLRLNNIFMDIKNIIRENENNIIIDL